MHRIHIYHNVPAAVKKDYDISLRVLPVEICRFTALHCEYAGLIVQIFQPVAACDQTPASVIGICNAVFGNTSALSVVSKRISVIRRHLPSFRPRYGLPAVSGGIADRVILARFCAERGQLVPVIGVQRFGKLAFFHVRFQRERSLPPGNDIPAVVIGKQHGRPQLFVVLPRQPVNAVVCVPHGKRSVLKYLTDISTLVVFILHIVADDKTQIPPHHCPLHKKGFAPLPVAIFICKGIATSSSKGINASYSLGSATQMRTRTVECRTKYNGKNTTIILPAPFA